jgi:hypothetical protein
MRGARGCDFEIEEVENGEALESTPARHCVVAGLIASHASSALGHIQDGADAGAVEMVGKFGAFEREPTYDVGAKRQREAVRVKPMQGSGWREGCKGSGGGIH